MIRNCRNCEIKFNAINGNQYFCTKRCAARYRNNGIKSNKTMIIKKCEICTMDFETTQSHTKYCSIRCKNRAFRIEHPTYHSKRYNPEKHRKQSIKRIYGLEWETYKEMYENQNHKCAICSVELKLVGELNLKSGAHIDHDHATNKVRGLLCHNCNAGIGYLQDNPEILRKAVEYFKHKDDNK